MIDHRGCAGNEQGNSENDAEGSFCSHGSFHTIVHALDAFFFWSLFTDVLVDVEKRKGAD